MNDQKTVTNKVTKMSVLREKTVAEATKAATLIAGFGLTIYHNTNNVITGVTKEQHLETLTSIYKNLVSMCDGNIDMKVDGISGIGSATTMEQNLAQNGSYELLPEVFNYIDSVEEKEETPVEYVAPEASDLSEFKKEYLTGKERMAKDKKVYMEELVLDKTAFENVVNATYSVVNRVGLKSSQEVKTVSVTTKNAKRNKNIEIITPLYEIWTLKRLFEEVGEDMPEFFKDLTEEQAWMDFAVTNLNGKLNVYSANMLVAKTDVKPGSLGGFEKVPTSKYMEAIEKATEKEVLLNAEKGIFENINNTEMFYMKEMDRRPSADKEAWNAAVFTFIGSTEDLEVSTTEFFGKAFSIYYVTKNWAASIVADRKDAKIVYKNEWTHPVGGSSPTAVEFKGFVQGEKVEQFLHADIEVLFKMNRLMNTNKGCIPAAGFKSRLSGDNQVAMLIFNEADTFIDSTLNMGVMTKETAVSLLPKYLAEKSNKLATGDFTALTLKAHTMGLKRELYLHNNLKVKALGENTDADLNVGAHGHLLALMIEKEVKAEIGAGLYLQDAYRKVLQGQKWEDVRPTLEDFMEATKTGAIPELKKGFFEFTRINKNGEESVNVEECYYMLASIGVHAKKDNINAVGKSMIGTTRTTLQGLNSAVLQLDGSLEESFKTVAKEKLISKKELNQVALAMGCEVVYLKEEKTNDFKFFVADNASKTEKQRNRTMQFRNDFPTNETFNAAEADIIIGSGFGSYNRTNGFRFSTIKNGILTVSKMMETTAAEGKIALKTVGSNIHTTETVKAAFPESKLISQEILEEIGAYLREIVKGSFVLDPNATKHQFFRWLEQTQAIEIETGKWFIFATNNKTIVDRLPSEMTMAMLAYSALKSSLVSLDQLMNFNEKEILEDILENNYAKFMAIKSTMLKQVKNARKNSVEDDGEFFVLANETREAIYSASNTIMKAHQELRADVFTKGMKKYLTRELNRAICVVITHKESANVAFVNEKTFKKMLKAGVIVEENGLFYTSLKRYPETLVSQVTVRIIVRNNIADNVIAISVAMLSFLLGDTDGDTVEVLRPLYNNVDSEFNKAAAAYKDTLKAFYKEQYQIDTTREEMIKKANKMFEKFGANPKEILMSYRTGLLLNEGTEALTGRIVNWDTKLVEVFFDLGASKKEIKEFKAILGAYVAQISIAAKNNDGDALTVFKNNWQNFADGTTFEDIIKAVLTSVECKYFI